MNLTFSATDNGNCRVYYKEGRKLRCFQEDQRDTFTLYICSSDGEPSHEAWPATLTINRTPDDDSSTAVSFRRWWEAHK